MTGNKTFRWVKRLLVCGVLGTAGGYGGWYWFQTPGLTSAPQYQVASVSRGEVVQVVTASGQLNPEVQVEVGSQISGIIQKLLADFNSTVKEGQLIAEIDPATYEAAAIQAEGNLAKAKAALELAQLTEIRARTLRADKLNPQADYDQALADLHQAQAVVKINEGALKQAQADLARCRIHAPIDGVVISRHVNVGQTVAASLSAPTLFVIANDLSKMQIQGEVAEADIGQVEVGQDVDFTVDALPGLIAHGKVAQIRYAPNTNQTVVTYDTVIKVDNPHRKFLPGMTANVSIIVARHDNALEIPNAALRFRPSKTSELAATHTTGEHPVKAPAASGSKPDGGKPKKDKRKAERTVYVQQDGALEPVKLKLGITDGRETEVIEGLKEGDAVVVGMTEPKEGATMLSRLFTGVRK